MSDIKLFRVGADGTREVYVNVDPSTIALEPGFTRDVRSTGHWGTGDLEITIRDVFDSERAKPLLIKSYEAS